MLANLDREKFIELLGKLGSEKDEDALSAARDLNAQVTVAQLSWDDLLVPDQGEASVARDDAGDDAGDDSGDDAGEDDGDYRSDLLDANDADDDEDEDNLFDEDDEKDLTDEEKSEALSLIDKISALEISKGTKEELTEYKKDIDDGDFAHMDLRYLRALYGRLAK
ncbi:MAG: hypothetical protein P8J29_08235 [Rhodospirillales bacterium]|nr:hypothetical protein [Rhodospirillales bacterium]